MSDRTWMYRKPGEKTKYLDEFMKGVEEFLDFAYAHPTCVDRGRIRCPSSKCDFFNYKTREEVQICLLKYGFRSNYMKWTRHGESAIQKDNSSRVDTENMHWEKEMIMEAMGQEYDRSDSRSPNTESNKFYDMLQAADEPLWEGCKKHTKLSATTRLLHLKSEHRMTNRCIDDMLTFIKELLPESEKMPDSFYRIKAMVKNLGLSYEKIHACENDCVLFWGDNSELDACPTCHEPRFKPQLKDNSKQLPKKVLRYFPLIPRLQRLYLSSKTAEHMRWHSDMRCEVDGELRHPADAEAWKDFDRKHPLFANEVRNIRLGLATDGFNPFGHSSKPHSTWPVFLVPYNLPPWMCMKESYMFMSLLIPGPKSPGKDIDVYLRPLIEELKTLWDVGVHTYDSSLKENFQLRAAVIWTISDFPAYGMLSGWSTHGKLSCPVCMDTNVAFYLKHGRKPCYFGCHRRWLDPTHTWRTNKNKFNKQIERKEAPPRWTGEEILDYLAKFDSIKLGKGKESDSKIPGFGSEHNWTKKSIFFELPYWCSLLIRHNLDLMHIEKNVFDNVFNTVMNVKGKSKDNVNARKDLKELGIRDELHPIEGSNGKWVLPKSKYTLTTTQIRQVYEWLKSLKVPDGYASNISRCVNVQECRILGLKSHDCHVFMERFLPLAFYDFLPKNVWEPLHALSKFFRDICSKVYKEEELEKLEASIVETMCRLEMIFPPSFFDSMEHLPIHLAYEAKVGGPVQYRWMYPFERCMHSLKGKVRNKACPEGSIAEAYWIDELMNFCSRYFDISVPTKLNRSERTNDGGEVEDDGRLPIFCLSGRPIGKSKNRYLSNEDRKAASLYILSHSNEAEKYAVEHKDYLRITYPNMSDEELEREHDDKFAAWFKKRIMEDSEIDDVKLQQLAMGPSNQVASFGGFIVNGFRFHTDKRESSKTTQNSGVLVKGTTYNESERDYYGHLEEVVQLKYYGKGNTVFLFKCHWYDAYRGVEVDKYGITRVNTKSKLRSNDPFVLASQALQVFYANPVSRNTKGWCSVITTKARNTYDIIEKEGEDSIEAEEETFQEDEAPIVQLNDDEEMDDIVLVDDAEIGEEVELTESIEEEKEEEEEDIDDYDSNSVSESEPEEDDF